ncbi:iron-sulfur cluster biosynthesis family protein [Alkalihalobacillus trypoxylicola]|nr:iron-sulfur cluster biosynthesis family protein [Alkalihalobacillus trypoxylicola]
MNIILTEDAKYFVKQQLEEGAPLRVVAFDTFECSTMVDYKLMKDSKKENDQMIEVEGITFLYDQKAIEEIGDYLKIDYISNQGIKLTNKNQILAYARTIE